MKLNNLDEELRELMHLVLDETETEYVNFRFNLNDEGNGKMGAKYEAYRKFHIGPETFERTLNGALEKLKDAWLNGI